VTFCLAACLLFRYGNWMKHHIIVTIAVLIAWYFSFLIIFVLPLDVSSVTITPAVQENVHHMEEHRSMSSDNFENVTVVPVLPPANCCKEPWSNVPENVFPNLWRVVYWTSQCLTWLVLPLMQSYIKAGDFTIRGKLKSALIDNAIYYGSYLFICGNTLDLHSTETRIRP
ncbi:hypothetical protein L9F63_018978, partial [Diploptera punctata]